MDNQIFTAINQTMADIGAVGKNSKNTQQGFMFRGIDAVMNALNPAMVKNGIFVVPSIVEETREERTTKSGSVMYAVRLLMDYTFYAKDGSNVVARVIGEAMDSADKATNKAMSIAFKYACFQTFCIPTEEMKETDPDAHSPEETMPKKEKKEAPKTIDDIKVKTLMNLMEKKGVKEEQMLARYKVKALKDMTIDKFTNAMQALEATKDKVAKPQEDLGFK